MSSVCVCVTPHDDVCCAYMCRVTAAQRQEAARKEAEALKPKKPKGRKDFKLISFGDEAEEDEQSAVAVPGKYIYMYWCAYNV